MAQDCHILGININSDKLDQILATIHRWIDDGQPHQICTVNTEFVMEARRNSKFATAVNQADLRLADGAGIILAAQLLHQPIPPRITGVDLVPILAKEAAEQGYSIFLLGGKGGVGQKTAEILTAKNPGLKIAGLYEGSPEDQNVIPIIHHSSPHILLVAWGAPKQDIWIHQHKQELNVPVMMGVGGTFDFITGVQKRAPKWMRDLGLEWLWRLIREPSRWKRQLALPQMFLLIFWLKLTGKA